MKGISWEWEAWSVVWDMQNVSDWRWKVGVPALDRTIFGDGRYEEEEGLRGGRSDSGGVGLGGCLPR